MKILCYPGDCFWATLWSKSPPPPGATPFVIIANHLHLSLAIYAPATHIAVTWDPCGRLGNLAVLGLSNIWASVCVCVCVCVELKEEQGIESGPEAQMRVGSTS
jgi:hypothetical protein